MWKTLACGSCCLHFPPQGLVFSNARRVLSQYNTRLRLLYLLIIIKFQYNARSHWFKQRGLWQYKAQRTNESSRHHPQKWRISFRTFFKELFNLEVYCLYDLDNEEENEFLAAVDLENVNVTDKVDTATVEKADKSTEVNKHIDL